MKNSKEIFIELLEHLKLSANKLSVALGHKNNTKIYHVKNGRNKISSDLAKEITDKFSDISYSYLLTGEGEMLKSETKHFQPEGKIIDVNELPVKYVHIIPIKGRGGLESSYFADEIITKLETEKLSIKIPSSNGSKWFKIEVEGISMDDSTSDYDGSKYSLCEGDWAYCRSIPRVNWRNKLHLNSVKVFCFFHNQRGIIFKKVKSHNEETGELLLSSLNPDKKQFPDFTINVGECSYICNVIKVLSEF
ncbi:hypothetical protein [Polaribacter aestuariivivens]|uniref:hypothetical protein n=1 Tax=Polaribacter aestuariivivens TaxID=2304626 RepID=UPI003F494B38